MAIVWDPNKQRLNLAKHKVDFVDIDEEFFNDPNGLVIPDNDHDEQRFVRLAVNSVGDMFLAVYAYDVNGDTRLISARKPSSKERKAY
ncbi:BrnT family toxin [Burkholderia gladioli]